MFSTKNVEMSQAFDPLDRTTETEARLWILFLPLGGEPTGLEAASRILNEQDADYLTNVEVTEGGGSLLAVSYGWAKVQADPWRQRASERPAATPAATHPVATEPPAAERDATSDTDFAATTETEPAPTPEAEPEPATGS